MPLVNVPPTSPEPAPGPVVINAEIVSPAYKHSLVDTKITPHSSLLTHIEGASWTVDYYSQVVGRDEQLSPLQPSQPEVYQQYLLIKGYEMKLQGSLSPGQDAESTSMTLTGTAMLYPFLKPNVGDMFIADIGDGRAGEFTITSPPVKKTLLKETCWEISFELRRYVDAEVVRELNTRVVRTTNFVKDFLTYGQNPIIADVDLEAKEKIEEYIRQLLNIWLMKFYSKENRTAVVPGQTGATYDPYVVQTMFRIFDRNEHPLLGRIRELNCQGLPQVDELLIWNCMINMDLSIRSIMQQKVWLISTKYFSNYALHDGVYFSAIERVVYPHAPFVHVDEDYQVGNCSVAGGSPYIDLQDMDVEMSSVYQFNIAGGFDDPGEPVEPTFTVEEIPLIHPVSKDDYYVFTIHFYNQTPGLQSVLELQINDMIAGRAINKDKIFSLVADIPKWGRLEQFYYIPALLILLKVMLRKL